MSHEKSSRARPPTERDPREEAIRQRMMLRGYRQDARADIESLLGEVSRLRVAVAAYREAAQKVLEGFDKGVFMRDASGDDSSKWALKLLPYVAALSELARLLGGDQP